MESPSSLSFFMKKYFLAGHVENIQQSREGASQSPFVKWLCRG
jgi:hypothetical protein